MKPLASENQIEYANKLITKYVNGLQYMLSEASLLDLVEIDDAPNYRDGLCEIRDLNGNVLLVRSADEIKNLNMTVTNDFKTIQKGVLK